MSHNFTPTLHQVQVASRKLPEVTLWPEREIAIAIPVSGKSQLVIFEKYTKKNRNPTRLYAGLTKVKLLYLIRGFQKLNSDNHTCSNLVGLLIHENKTPCYG